MEKLLPKNIKFLRKKMSINQTEIGLQLNKTHKIVSNWETGFSEPSYEDIIGIGNFFGISIDDLLTKDLSNSNILAKEDIAKKQENSNKKGNIYSNNLPKLGVNEGVAQYGNSMMPKVVTMDTQGNENVVLVPVKAMAGYLNGYGDEEYISTLPAYRLPGLGNGTFRLFEVGGLSMHPTLNDKDMVIGSFVESLTAVRDDRVYVVVTKSEGIVVKRCLNRFQTDGKLILKSDNYKNRDDYPTIVSNPEDILEIWYVTGFMSRQLRPPAEMYTRLIDLEARLTLTEEKLKKQLP
jgi:phage repressor protein C with HTH and peptisase S24 domain